MKTSHKEEGGRGRDGKGWERKRKGMNGRREIGRYEEIGRREREGKERKNEGKEMKGRG